MTDHPLTRLLLYRYLPPQTPAPTGTLDLTAHHWINRSSRTAEYLTALHSDPASGLVVGSLYAGLLSIVEVAPKRAGEDDDEMDVEMETKKSALSKRNAKGKRKEGMRGDTNDLVEEAADDAIWGPMTFREKYDE